jgi:TetR/AcrR family transcriptional regulator
MSRNKELNQKIKDDRREQILVEAMKLFVVKGLAATRITEISMRSGISQGLTYHYFSSKKEIFTCLISQAFERMNEAARNLESLSIPAREKIILAIDELLNGFEKNDTAASYFYLITQAAMSEAAPNEVKEIIRTQNDFKYEVIQRILVTGQKEGTVKDFNPEQMTTAFWSMINGLAINKAVNGNKFIKPDKSLLLTMFLKDFN